MRDAMPCAVCGGAMPRGMRSYPDRHTICAATPELKEDLLQLMEQFPRLTYDRLARDLHMNTSALYRWLRAAMDRRLRVRQKEMNRGN
jgi:transposase-like protein